MRFRAVSGVAVVVSSFALPHAPVEAGGHEVAVQSMRLRGSGSGAADVSAELLRFLAQDQASGEHEQAETGEASVVLLGPGVPLDASKIIATMGAVLRSGRFREEVVAEVQSRYFGYMIDRRQRDRQWEFVGPALGFTARYGATRTAEWPDRTRFLYEDSRRNALSLVALSAPTGVEGRDNLRIYYRPERVGFENGEYQTQDILVLAFLSADSGRQSTYVYRLQDGEYQLYRYEPARTPRRPGEASVVSILGVATTDSVGIRVLFARIDVAVPRHTYSRGMYRVFAGRNYEGSSTPMGPAIRFTGVTAESSRAPFEAALAAFREGRPLTAEEFRRVFRYVQQAHRYLVEPSAGAAEG